jgi:hypothetical protein
MAQTTPQRPHDAGDTSVIERANPAGRVEHDRRGKAIWRWARETLDSTTILLKRLENDALSLEPTQKVAVARGEPKTSPARGHSALSLEPEGERDAGGGFDPYNSGR